MGEGAGGEEPGPRLVGEGEPEPRPALVVEGEPEPGLTLVVEGERECYSPREGKKRRAPGSQRGLSPSPLRLEVNFRILSHFPCQ